MVSHFVLFHTNLISPPSHFDHKPLTHKTSLTHLCRPVRSTFAVRETASLGQQMLNAPVGINGLIIIQKYDFYLDKTCAA